MSERRTNDATLIHAVRTLARSLLKVNDDNAPVFSAALSEVATRLETLVEERRWIPVEEKLPSGNVAVLAWGPFNGGAEMVWRENGKWNLSFVGTYIPDSTYTDWMPLPPGPEASG